MADEVSWMWLLFIAGGFLAAMGWLYTRIQAVEKDIASLNRLYIPREELRDDLNRIELGQRDLLIEFKELATQMRHKVNNLEQGMVLLDERQKQQRKPGAPT